MDAESYKQSENLVQHFEGPNPTIIYMADHHWQQNQLKMLSNAFFIPSRWNYQHWERV